MPAGCSVHVLREVLHVLEWSHGENTVTEVEDVAGPSIDATQDVVDLSEHAFDRPQQQCWVEVSLYRAVHPYPLPPLIDRNAPVDSDDVATGVRQ